MKIVTAQFPEMLTARGLEVNRLTLTYSPLCLSGERCVTDHTGVSVKGLSGRELKFCSTEKFFHKQLGSRTKLFQMGDVQEQSLTVFIFFPYSDSFAI